MKHGKLYLLVFTVLFLAQGCGKNIRYVKPNNSIIIYNKSSNVLNSIFSKKCGAPDENYFLMAEVVLKSYAYIELPIIEGCVDLIAYDKKQNVLGKQSNLKMVPGTKWILY